MIAGVGWKDLEMELNTRELDEVVFRREFEDRRRQRAERSMANNNKRAREQGQE